MTLMDLRDRLRDWPGATSGGPMLPGLQRLFGALALLVVLGMLPGLALFGSWPRSLLGVAGVALLGVLWRRPLQGRAPGPTGLVLEAIGLLLAGVGVAGPARALPMLYVGTMAGSLHVRTRLQALGRAATVFAVYVLVVAEAGDPILAADTLTQAMGLVIVALIMHMLSTSALRQDADRVRQAALATTSAELVGATTLSQLDAAAVAAAARLGATTASVAVGIATRERVPPPRGHRWVRTLVASELDESAVLLAAVPEALPLADRRAIAGLGPQLSLARERILLAQQLAGHAETLRRNAAQAEALIRNASDVIRMIDADGRVRFESEAVVRVLGYEPSETVGTHALDILHPDDRARAEAVLDALLQGPGNQFEVVGRLRHRDGTWRHAQATVRNLLDDPDVRAVVINYHDVTDRHQLERQLRHQALHDPLTGLANRALFLDRLAVTARAARRNESTAAVLFVDLDDFKDVNDGLGHQAGDHVLRVAAERLLRAVREEDTVARLGGDEFALLLDPVTDAEQAVDIATRILEGLRRPVGVGAREIVVEASVGLVMCTGDTDAETLLGNADVAMYRAKRGGKARTEVFDPSMHSRALERLTLRRELSRAIPAGDVVVHYQPVVHLRTGVVVGAEALVRWAHPERGLLPPGEFLDVAEETGLIVDIGRHVLDEACHRAATWTRETGRPLAMHVNVSAAELQDEDLPRTVRRGLERSGLDPAQLTLELTESMLITEGERAREVLAALASLGVRVALDDFGTGYSSFAHLQRFAVHELKIDRSFVDVDLDGPDGRLTAALVALGRHLDLTLVAEGVERPEQAARLCELGCDLAQGWLFSPAVPAEEFAAVLADPTWLWTPSRQPA